MSRDGIEPLKPLLYLAPFASPDQFDGAADMLLGDSDCRDETEALRFAP